MNNLLKILIVSVSLSLAIISPAQKVEYIVKGIKGTVEYKMQSTEAWQPVKRLMSLPKSATVKMADGSQLTVYSQSNPQALVISKAGENRLRTLITESEKQAAQSRGQGLTDIFEGGKRDGKTMKSGTGYRGSADKELLQQLTIAVKSPSTDTAGAVVGLSLIKNSEGDFAVELSNVSDIEKAIAVIVDVDGRYSALRISDDPANPYLLTCPAGMRFIVPECTLIGVDNLKAIAVAADEVFDPQILCLLLNADEDSTGEDAVKNPGIIAVEAVVK